MGVSKLFRHIFLKKENTAQKRQNNLNDICDMAKVRDLRDFYKTVTKKNNGKSDDKVPPFLSSASGSVNQAEISIISNEIKSYTQPRKNYNTSVPERIKNEVGEYALIHGTKSALEKFGKKYPKYTFIRTSVNNWKKKNKKGRKMIMPPCTEEKVDQTS